MISYSWSCFGCKSLSLDRLRKAASIDWHFYSTHDDAAQRLSTIIQNPPIFLYYRKIQECRVECSLCAMIFQEVDGKARSEEEILWAFRCPDLDDRLLSIWIYLPSDKWPIAKINCHADEGSYASKYIVYRPIGEPGSQTAIARINGWLQNCQLNHTECALDLSGVLLDYIPALPTRVLDVHDYPQSLKLVETNGKKAKYVALSHCWGGMLDLRTTKDLLHRHREHIPCDRLPKTIRDAAWLTKALEFQYLWIDSLCIIQGDSDDFDRESRKMARVYENAILTIAATSAKDGTGGLFKPYSLDSCIKLPCSPGDNKSGDMYFRLHREPKDTIFESPLNKRAWVLQEHLFARRTVHFTFNQMYWECHNTFQGEDNSSVTSDADMTFPNRALLCYFLDGFRRFRRNAQCNVENDWTKFVDVYTSWAQLVRFYTARQMTNPDDKLPAILSLCLELERILGPPFKFHSGLLLGPPYAELQSLLWRAQPGTLLQRPTQWRAPTWSWASLDGPIDFVDMIHNGHRMHWFTDFWHPCDQDLKVLGVCAHRVNDTMSYQALMLNGVILECFTSQDSSVDPIRDCALNSLARVDGPNGDSMQGEFNYDIACDQPQRFWLIPVFTRWKSEKAVSPVYYCLIVTEAVHHPFKGRVFERVGSGMVYDVKCFRDCHRGFIVLV